MMDPATLTAITQLVRLAILALTAGTTFVEAKRRNSAQMATLADALAKIELGDLTEDDRAAIMETVDDVLGSLRAQRKAALDALPTPTHPSYTR